MFSPNNTCCHKQHTTAGHIPAPKSTPAHYFVILLHHTTLTPLQIVAVSNPVATRPSCLFDPSASRMQMCPLAPCIIRYASASVFPVCCLFRFSFVCSLRFRTRFALDADIPPSKNNRPQKGINKKKSVVKSQPPNSNAPCCLPAVWCVDQDAGISISMGRVLRVRVARVHRPVVFGDAGPEKPNQNHRH